MCLRLSRLTCAASPAMHMFKALWMLAIFKHGMLLSSMPSCTNVLCFFQTLSVQRAR